MRLLIIRDKKNADIMNEYFVNVTKNLDIPEFKIEQLPINTNIVCTDPIDHILFNYKNHPSILKINESIKLTETFTFSKVNETPIKTEILELNPKKSAGFDAIPSKIIKDSIKVLTSPLTNLFNTSVIESVFPSDLKYANVTPLYKKDDNTNKENYRPISILPTIYKIFERLMFHQITSFVSCVLSPYLCGFRKGDNAQHALLRLKNKLNICLDKREYIGMFMMDLSKAFDCIPHEILIAKLHAYGFSRDSLKLIYNYLKDRKQQVKINAEYSSWEEIPEGVPQGSVLGTLLFNIFTNDFFVEMSEVCNYADDNSLTVANICTDTTISKLESDVHNLDTWFKNNDVTE